MVSTKLGDVETGGAGGLDLDLSVRVKNLNDDDRKMDLLNELDPLAQCDVDGNDDDNWSSSSGSTEMKDGPPSSTFQTSVRFVKETDTDFSADHQERKKKDESFYYKEFAKGANRRIQYLRVTVLLVWLGTAVVVSYGIYRFAKTAESETFESEYKTLSRRLLENFDTNMDKRLVAINSMSTMITTFARETNQTFPFVTTPDFSIMGSNTRVLADSLVLGYMPLVTDDDREEWEDYSMKHRTHADLAYEQDKLLIEQQDARFGYSSDRKLQGESEENDVADLPTDSLFGNNENILDDGSFYHPGIFWNPSTGASEKDSGPYFPFWQRSPVSPIRQGTLNYDMARYPPHEGIMDHLLKSPYNAVMSAASIPETANIQAFESYNLPLSQYRHGDETYTLDPRTQLVYPVLNEYDEKKERKLVGIITNTIYWKLYFRNVLPENAQGFLVVVENSFGQAFSYRIDGADASFLGAGDARNPNVTEAMGSQIFYEKERSQTISAYDKYHSPVETQSYTTLPLDSDFSEYTLKIYPSRDFSKNYETNQPATYAALVACIFLFATIAFLLYDYFVRRRQTMMMAAAIQSARKATAAERDLNEYIAHEVRNPLSAALSACSFVSSEVHEEPPLNTEEAKQVVREDIRIIGSSLTYINDLLRNMLDLHRASADQIIIQNTMCNIFDDILEPVSSMIYRRRNHNFDLILDCPPDICTYTDGLRLKQILLNLALNSAKFIQTGFVKLRVVVIDRMFLEESDETKEGEPNELVSASQRTTPQKILFMVEDSGPGIPAFKVEQLFTKFEKSLDLLSQGKGIALCLCKHLVELMGGEIWLDDSYDSGIEGKPGSRFIVDLDISPLQSFSKPSNPSTLDTVSENVMTVANPRLNEQRATEAKKLEEHNQGQHHHPSPESSISSQVPKGETADGAKLGPANTGAPDLSMTESTASFSMSTPSIEASSNIIGDVESSKAGSTNDISDSGNKQSIANARLSHDTSMQNDSPLPSTDVPMASTPPPDNESEGPQPHRSPNENARRLSANVTEFLGPPTTTSDSPNSTRKFSPQDSFQKQQEVEELLKIGAKPVQLKHARKITTPDLKDNLNTPKAKQDEATKSKPTLPDTNTPTPKAAPAPSPSVVTKKETPDDGIPKTLSILFVDDDKMLRKLFTRSIKRVLPEWSVEDVESGELALEKVASKSYDLIFMDQYMSSTTKNLLGTETVLELRRRGVSCKICGLSANDVEVEFLKVGADAFLSKPMPCNKDELRKVLKQLVCGDE